MLCSGVSNYLFAFGCSKLVKNIERTFSLQSDDMSEISLSEINKDTSLLAISKSHRIIEIDDSKIFFRGWFQDHDSRGIVLGQRGFEQWLKRGSNRDHALNNDYEGAYVSAIFADGKLSIRNDKFSYLPVIHFSSKKLFVCSDSMYVISEVRKALGMPCKLNQKVMHSRAWTHGLSCAVMSNQTQIKNVELLSPGKHIEIKLHEKAFSSTHFLNGL